MNLFRNFDEFGGIVVTLLDFVVFGLRVGFGCGRTEPSNPNGKSGLRVLFGHSRNQRVNHVFHDAYLGFTGRGIRALLEMLLGRVKFLQMRHKIGTTAVA